MLKNTWSNSNKKFAYSGITKIYEHYRGALPIKKIKEELTEIDTYTRFRPTKKIKHFNPFFTYSKDELWQIDLMYLPDLSQFNDGYKYLACVLDTFSRKLNILPLKKKDGKSVTRVFDEIHKIFKNTPKKIYADNGGEFKCSEFMNYCEFFGIKLIFTSNETKAAHVERAQQSFQNILYRMMHEKQTKSFLDLLPAVLKIYNNRVNRITKFSPNNAYKTQNEGKVLINLEKYYKSSVMKKPTPSFKVGDTVRIKIKRNKFERGYDPYFSEEVFKIISVKTNLPQPRYKLSDYSSNEVIGGTFYERELTKAIHKEYKIEKILKKRKKGKKTEYFVKWLGYSNEHNSWVAEKWLRKIT